MSTTKTPLTQLQPGGSAIVQGFSPQLAPKCRSLLQIIGINRNTIIQLIRRAPLGDPLQLQVLGSQFCLRASEACYIYVVRLLTATQP